MTVNWDDIEDAAKSMFNIWTSGGDLAWAKEAWGHLVEAGLAQEFSFIDETRVCLRFVVLARIYEEFSAAKWNESRGRSFTELAEGLWIDDLALGILASEADAEYESTPTAPELREACLESAANACRPQLFECLTQACGGVERLYLRLSATRDGIVRDDLTDPRDNEPSGPNLDAYDFVRQGFHPRG